MELAICEGDGTIESNNVIVLGYAEEPADSTFSRIRKRQQEENIHVDDCQHK